MIDKILNWKIYKDWKAIKKGQYPINMKRGAGYYITLGLTNHNSKDKIYHIEMQSGRTALAKLIDYETYHDPSDMVKESYWHIMGYKGQILFKEMSFKEYLTEFTAGKPKSGDSE